MQHKKFNLFVLSLFFLGFIGAIEAQNTSNYWQQHVDYTMEVNMNVENFQYSGTQKLVYTNNSPDELTRVYYHLYFNAFQPGSEMDMRLQNIADPDGRMTTTEKKSRIASLTATEVGYLHATTLKQDAVDVQFNEEGTVLVVDLARPIPAGGKTTFEMEFNGQVPVQIRRSGRNNKDGVALSMSQWYPKLAEYDFEGWHADPYIAREFHGVWGDFDVKLTIDKNYIVGGTGYLQNPQEIGHGYEVPGTKVKNPRGKTLTWHFKAPMVHDFMWAADPEYVHDTLQMEDGPTLHFLYKNDSIYRDTWTKVQPLTEKAMGFFNKNIGEYPYDQYSVIQGGDGGMEYNMATLIINKKRKSGVRSLKSLIGVTVHEALHNWYQGMIATNESYYAWMDEGFVSYVEDYCLDNIFDENEELPVKGLLNSYTRWANTGDEEPASVHADYFMSDQAYRRAAYTKGAVALLQLNYIMGEEKLMTGLKKYHSKWSYKHPDNEDFIHLMELHSDLDLNWFFDRWINTTYVIDYKISDVVATETAINISIERVGLIPMPLDVTVSFKNGEKKLYYIPLSVMRGTKPNETEYERIQLPDWWWIKTGYQFEITDSIDQIVSIEIDESGRLADVNREDNKYEVGNN